MDLIYVKTVQKRVKRMAETCQIFSLLASGLDISELEKEYNFKYLIIQNDKRVFQIYTLESKEK